MRVRKKDLLSLAQRSLSENITDLTCEALGGDASDRNYYRLHLNFHGLGALETLVVMELQAPFPENELPFLNILHTLERSGLGVPRLYGMDPRKGLILLEDLGEEVLQKKVEGKKPELVDALYREALDNVVKMQCDIPSSSGCLAFDTAFTVEKFVWELDFFRVHYIEGFLGRTVHPHDRRAMNRLFSWLASLLDGEKKVFTHRDYHSRNLIYHNGRLKMLDFQDARMGLAQYDVASLLRDAYVVLEDAPMRSLLTYYESELKRRTGTNIDGSRFRYLFDMTSLQRNLKAIGTFAYQAVGRNNPGYLKYVPDTLSYIEKNLHRYDELAPYREVLLRYLPFGKG